MTRLLKCYGHCNNKYKKEDLIKEGAKNYCKECLIKIRKDREDRELLYQTIQKIYNIPFPTGQMLKQISTFNSERDYSYENMTKTICYFIKVMKKTPTYNGGISFVPWYYDKAVAYYEELERKREESKDIESNNLKVLKIRDYSTVDTREPVIKKRFIQMGDVLNDG